MIAPLLASDVAHGLKNAQAAFNGLMRANQQRHRHHLLKLHCVNVHFPSPLCVR